MMGLHELVGAAVWDDINCVLEVHDGHQQGWTPGSLNTNSVADSVANIVDT